MTATRWPWTDLGPVRFDHFMEAALYDPEHGFFGAGRGRPGRRGDFITSPEVGPLFGAVVGRALDRWWVEAGRPDPFTVIDAGAGVGTLARSILAAAPACSPALDLLLVERAAPLRDAHPVRRGVRSAADLPAGALSGVVLANELLDNLAVRLLERAGEAWLEVWVGPDGPQLCPTELAGPSHGLSRRPSNGARVAVATQARAWVTDVVDRLVKDRLVKGRLVVFDYTVETPEMVARPMAEWLRTYRGHQRGDEPWHGPGTQDITCDVPLDQLPVPDRVTAQAAWLTRHGLEELVEEGRRAWKEGAHRGDLAALRARSTVREAEALTDTTGLGAFTVAEWTRPG